MAAGEAREIDWRSAEVRGGTLTVDMIGASSKAWRARFASVLTLLDGPHTSWGDVSLGKKRIQVTGLEEGAEMDVRHFLESIVLEVNSALEPEAPLSGDGSSAAAEPATNPDERMAATFRSFASESG